MHTVHVTVKPGLTVDEGRKRVWRAAKHKGKTDARSITYDPKTGKGSCT